MFARFAVRIARRVAPATRRGGMVPQQLAVACASAARLASTSANVGATANGIKLTEFAGEPRHAPFARRTVEVAERNVRAGGRPFATVIVETATGRIVAEAGNEVAQTGDPTAHAEIVAIRQLAARIGETMEGHTFYILTEMCPMCMAAMYYCGPDEVVYLTTRKNYSQVG